MKKKQVSSQRISLDVISYQLKEIHIDVCKNSRDIEQLKSQVAMGKGGIKAVFVVGSLIALILGALRIFKIWG